MKNKRKEDDYKVLFGGAMISSKEANKVGVALLFGFVGIVTIGSTFGIQDKLTLFIIAFVLACVGYFVIGSRCFKKR